MNNCRILLSTQFRRLLIIDISPPILPVDNAFHLANIINSVSYFFTISNIVELRYHNVQSLTNAIVARRSPISDKNNLRVIRSIAHP